MLFLNPLRALSALRGSILLTAEHAENAKDSIRAFIPTLFPITLRVLSVLSGLILFSAKSANPTKKQTVMLTARLPIAHAE